MNAVRLHVGQKRSSGWSLMELLVVIGILALLTGMIIPAVGTVTRAMAISNAGSILFEELTQARVISSSLNRPIEVRLYLASETESPARDSVQLFVASGNGSEMRPHTRRRFLSENVKLLPGLPYSSLLSFADGPLTQEDGETYYSFRILPQGVMDLTAPSLPTLTVVHRTEAVDDDLPSNFVTVQINPRTARVQMFRP